MTSPRLLPAAPESGPSLSGESGASAPLAPSPPAKGARARHASVGLTLAYVSVADHAISAAELEDIVMRSAAGNIELGVTGILLFNGMNFFHILQGEAQSVEALFGRIARDRRHHAVSRLPAQPFEHLHFPAWGMVFWGRDNISDAAEFRFAATLGRAALDFADAGTQSILRGFLGIFGGADAAPRRGGAGG